MCAHFNAPYFRQERAEQLCMEWMIEVALVQAVLWSKVLRIRRRSRIREKQDFEMYDIWSEKERLELKIIPIFEQKKQVVLLYLCPGMLQLPSESYFWYNVSAGEYFSTFQHPEFVPNFDPLADCHGDQALIANVTSTCTINGQVEDSCRYDYCTTGSAEFALSTLGTVSANNNTVSQLSTNQLIVFLIVLLSFKIIHYFEKRHKKHYHGWMRW